MPHITAMLARPRLFAFLILLVVIAAIGWFLTRPDVARLPLEAVTGPKPRITEPRYQNIPTVNVPKAVGWAEGIRPQPAPGFAVAAFASGLDHPRWLYELPNGDVLVAETNRPKGEDEGGITGAITNYMFKRGGSGAPSANRITLLRDADGDGVAELRTPFLTGLASPFGMVLVGDQLYVANHDALVVVPYVTGATRITAAPRKVVALPGGGGHWTKSLAASPDGQLLYIGVGSTSNIGENGMDVEVNRANVLELNLAKKSIRIYSSGLRNPVGLAWEPRSQALWTVVNERDMMGSDLPPDYMTRLDFGAFYGWPYSYWGGYADGRVDERPDLLQYTRRPDYALGPHAASLGIAFGSIGPAQGGAFVTQRGSWNRSPIVQPRVMFVPFDARGFPNGPMRPVLQGFMASDDSYHGRPVGIIARARGDLLVADDAGNRVWRVTAER